MDILLVEDSPGDIRLTLEVFRAADASVRLHVANDGAEAIAFLRRATGHATAPRPALILLDLNMPKMDGRELLALIKTDDDLKQIPTVILTTSTADEDVVTSYKLHANSYLRKPVALDRFEELVKGINDYWLKTASLPPTHLLP
jgi:two-component system, chemotaxis family, response regulator Rcp1